MSRTETIRIDTSTPHDNEMMTNAPLNVAPNDPARAERESVVAPQGFRDYDARWLFPSQLNLNGARDVGFGLANLLKRRRGKNPSIVVGHDFRAYSASVKNALVIGLLGGGCRVVDIGLCLSPTAYLAYATLNVDGLAMITASHNENGWTGIKMGCGAPLTFGEDDMKELKDAVLNPSRDAADVDDIDGVGGGGGGGGRLELVADMRERYLADVTSTSADDPLPDPVQESPKNGRRPLRLQRPLRVAVACGNGTAGDFAPDALKRIGCHVVEIDCNLDASFPRHNPNPEDMRMLNALQDATRKAKADVGFAFDGDGDRCGVADENGNPIFADRVALLLAKDIANAQPKSQFIVDVKSTSAFMELPDVTAEFWRTGHSHMKKRLAQTNAVAAFEKSGHYFLAPPFGRGYDDGIVAAVSICRMLDRAERTLSSLNDDLPIRFASPTAARICPDDAKRDVVAKAARKLRKLIGKPQAALGRTLVDLIEIDGVRAVLDDGAWGLVRASSNKPEIVMTCESPNSENDMRDVFTLLEQALGNDPRLGDYAHPPP